MFEYVTNHRDYRCSTERTDAALRQLLQCRDRCCSIETTVATEYYSTQTSTTVQRHLLQYTDINYSTETSTAVETSATVQRHLLR